MNTYKLGIQEDYKERYNNCVRAASIADIYKLDTHVVLCTTIEESHFSNDSLGEIQGPLQVAEWWCKDNSFSTCKFIHAGVRAIYLLQTCSKIDFDELDCYSKRRKKISTKSALCHYARGNICDDHGTQYASSILACSKRMKRKEVKWKLKFSSLLEI